MIKTRLITTSGKFYGITDLKKAVEFRFTDDDQLFPYYNLHNACGDKRKRKNVNETCVQIGSRCHCVKMPVPRAVMCLIGKDTKEAVIYKELELLFNGVKS